MVVRRSILAITVLLCIVSLTTVCNDCAEKTNDRAVPTAVSAATIFEGESFFKNVRQLTFGGQNAEAYFSHDASRMIFQATVDSFECDQIFTMNADGSDKRLVSTGKGRTTCSFIAPDGRSIIYCSTHLGSDDCLPDADMSQGYVWALYNSYDIFSADPDGGNIVRLTDAPGYDAEAVYSPRGDKIVFTSDRKPIRLTDNGAANFGPYFHPDGKHIIFCSNLHDTEKRHRFDLFLIDIKTKEIQQVTHSQTFDGFPMFFHDGAKLVFASNRDNKVRGETDIFIVDWVWPKKM